MLRRETREGAAKGLSRQRYRYLTLSLAQVIRSVTSGPKKARAKAKKPKKASTPPSRTTGVGEWVCESVVRRVYGTIESVLERAAGAIFFWNDRSIDRAGNVLEF